MDSSNMTTEFKSDDGPNAFHPSQPKKSSTVFPQMLARQENLLREYHKDTSAVLSTDQDHPLENIKTSGRHIATMYLVKTIYYSRAIIDNVNSQNLLVVFQAMRALVEVVAAVRYTLEKMTPIIHTCSNKGTITAEEARQSNYHCDLLLHGGRLYWAEFFQHGVTWDAINKKNKPRSKEERKKFEERNTISKSGDLYEGLVGKATDSWVCI